MAADVVITSTASPRYVITRELMQGVIRARRHRPLFLIDIAVPRDVDPRVENMDNVFLFDIDDLRAGRDARTSLRASAKPSKPSASSKPRCSAFEEWQRSLDLTPTLVALRERVRGGGARRARAHPAAAQERERRARSKALEIMCDAMVNKLLHRPITELKRSQRASPTATSWWRACDACSSSKKPQRTPLAMPSRERDAEPQTPCSCHTQSLRRTLVKLRIATRKSPLALAQARWIASELKRHHPGLEIEELHIVTLGDRIQDRPLSEVGGKGLFVTEIEQALSEGRADLAVHSMKDVPAELAPGLEIACVPDARRRARRAGHQGRCRAR